VVAWWRLLLISSDDIFGDVKSNSPAGLTTLLDLHESIMDQGEGYWIKIEAWEVPVKAEIPHGIRYSLTLHAPNGERILGYDNAHAARPSGKFKHSGQRRPYDHKHRHASDPGVAYEFMDAHGLLADFFAEVDAVILKHKMN